MDSRRVSLDLVYQGKNITKNIAPDLKNFSHTDNASGQADDVSIELKDESGKWISSWRPTKGDILHPKIITVNWGKDGDKQVLDCGIYMVDEPSYSGRPRVLNLGAVSTPANTDFMTTLKSRTWDGASLKGIARSIAKSAGLGLYYDSKTDPVFKSEKQSDEADVSYLFNICQKAGMSMKLYNNKIVIYSEAEYERKTPVATIVESDLLTGWSLNTTFTDTGYDGCLIEYTNPDTGEKLAYLFKAPGKKGKKYFKINEKADSYAEAVRLTKSKLRELNKKEYTGSLPMPGNLKWLASQTVRLKGFGFFDGVWFIDKISRTVGGGFTMSLDIHRILEGY
jgi:phage protein D